MIIPGNPGMYESPLVNSLATAGKVTTPGYLTSLAETQKLFKGGYVGGPRNIGLAAVGRTGLGCVGCTSRQNGMGCTSCSKGMGNLSEGLKGVLGLIGIFWMTTAMKGSIRL